LNQRGESGREEEEENVGRTSLYTRQAEGEDREKCVKEAKLQVLKL